jgi:hypothetical protein
MCLRKAEGEMEAGSMRHLLLLAIGVLVLAACASQSSSIPAPQSASIEARDKLVSDMRQCSQQYDYNPSTVADVAENALAPNELEWRKCAYDAILGYAQSNPAMIGKYQQLVYDDIVMTTHIQKYSMTRSNRSDRLNRLIADMRKMEDEQVQMAKADGEQQSEQVQAVYKEMSGLAL